MVKALKRMVARDGVARHYTHLFNVPLTGIRLDPRLIESKQFRAF